jgi:hypothetical protein
VRRRLLLLVAVLLLPGAAMGIAWGWRSAVVYLFFLSIALLVFLASRVGGDWLEGASRGRFRR